LRKANKEANQDEQIVFNFLSDWASQKVHPYLH